MQGGESAAPSQHMESPTDEEGDAMDASRAHGVHGPEPVLALRVGAGLESGLFVGWVLVKTPPNVVTSQPWYSKLAVTFNMAGFLKLTHWVVARGGNIIPSFCLRLVLYCLSYVASLRRGLVQKAVLSSGSVWLDALGKPGYRP